MPKYRIVCRWMMEGEFEVEAPSLKDAVELVEDGQKPYENLPDYSEYIDDSFEVDKDSSYELR